MPRAQLLVDNFNPTTLDGIMCKSLVSVGYDGSLYSCDFNYALGMGIGKTVAELKKAPDKKLAMAAKALVASWKQAVRDAEK